MFIAFLTLLSALSLAGVVGLFSIAGIMTIYAGAPFHSALIMGVVMEGAKLVSLSWLYRNWKSAGILLRGPLIAIALVIMLVTNIGVFGFLSKSHLEQGAATIDNSAKVEQINQQIAQEQSRIADNEKIVAQMDGAVNSFIGKDQANRSLSVRRSQAPQRKQLRDEISASQEQISKYNQQKFALESEVRKLQLEVGPIRYVAEIFHSNGDAKSIETAVQIFTLLIVLILDPAAVMLLLAANHSFAKRRNEKETKEAAQSPVVEDGSNYEVIGETLADQQINDESVLQDQQKTEDGPKDEPTLPHVQDAETHTSLPEPKINETQRIMETELGNEYDDISEYPGAETYFKEGEEEGSESEDILVSPLGTEALRIEVPEEKELVGDSLNVSNEKAILEKFSGAGSFVHQTPPATLILQPTMARVQKEISSDLNEHAEVSEMEVPIQTQEEIEDDVTHGGVPWRWSKFNDNMTKKEKQVKTLSWLKEFGKE